MRLFGIYTPPCSTGRGSRKFRRAPERSWNISSDARVNYCEGTRTRENMREFGKVTVLPFRAADVISIDSREITRYSAATPSGSETRALRNESRMNGSTKLALFEETILPHLNAAYNLAR